jgi:hypothetical protein
MSISYSSTLPASVSDGPSERLATQLGIKLTNNTSGIDISKIYSALEQIDPCIYFQKERFKERSVSVT